MGVRLMTLKGESSGPFFLDRLRTGAGSSKGSAKSSSIGWVYWMRRMHQIPPWRIFVY